VTGAVFESDDNADSSQDADVAAAYDEDQSGDDLVAGSEDVVADEGSTSHDADVDAGYED
jgi:hypothetical protein